ALDVVNALQGMVWHRRIFFEMARHAPWALRVVVALIARQVRWDWDRTFERFVLRQAPADQEILNRPEIRQAIQADWTEAIHQGSRGVYQDVRTLAMPWGFSADQIKTKIFLWHGDQDLIVPIWVGQRLAQNLPQCIPTYLPGEAHFLVMDRLKMIL